MCQILIYTIENVFQVFLPVGGREGRREATQFAIDPNGSSSEHGILGIKLLEHVLLEKWFQAGLKFQRKGHMLVKGAQGVQDRFFDSEIWRALFEV